MGKWRNGRRIKSLVPFSSNANRKVPKFGGTPNK